MNQAYLDIIKKNNRTLNKANEIMSDIQQAVAYNDENSVYDLSLDYERTVERLVPLSRDLVICQSRKESEQAVKQAIQSNAPVEINFTKEGWFVLSIPALLPRKEKGKAQYPLERDRRRRHSCLSRRVLCPRHRGRTRRVRLDERI